MTYLYYKSSYTTNTTKPNEKTINQWKHLAEKANWRITQLANGYYQTECSNPDSDDWHACLLYTSPSPRDKRQSRMPSSA